MYTFQAYFIFFHLRTGEIVKMNKSAYALLLSGLLGAGNAVAHVGTANLTLPISANGQATFAIAGGTSEIQFIVGHGCNPGETVPAPPAGLPAPGGLDTTKIEITVPAAIVTATGGIAPGTSVRPSHAGEFGLVTRTLNPDGSLTFLWTRNTAVAVADDQLYKVSIRLKTPAAAAGDFSIKKYQFLAKQICTHTPVGGTPTDHVMDWGVLNSPTILSFPEKRTGFNKYTLDASTLTDFGTAPVAAKLKSYFGDAAIVWVGKKAYSPNPNRSAKINALVTADQTYSNLGTDTGTTLLVTDTIWVKY
ncbi:MAG: hypothetical protein ABL858_00055, partial [Candidatus Nitrotoga sp.]